MSLGQLTLLGQAASALQWPEQVKVFRVVGENMAPLLREGDFVAVDTNSRQIREGLYALRLGGEVVVRRLQPSPQGDQVLISNDNRFFGPEVIAATELSGSIVGRVIFAEKHFD